MTHTNKVRLVYLPVIGILNIFLAYRFGTSGIETFYIASFVLAILFTWLNIRLSMVLAKSKTWLLFKIIGMLPLIFLWVSGIGAILSTTSTSIRNPQVDFPDVNTTLVLLGVIPYLLPRMGLYPKGVSATKLGVGIVASFISILVLFMSFLAFNDATNPYSSLMLVIAVQLQLIMNYVVIQTNYVVWSRQYIIDFCKRRGIYDETTQSTWILAITGLPFILPVLIAFVLSI